MPRRNATARRGQAPHGARRPTTPVATVGGRKLTAGALADMAESLVRRGLASPQILGERPWRPDDTESNQQPKEKP